MSQFFATGIQAVKESAIEREEKEVIHAEPGSLKAQILEVLEDRVRPFVQQDGGDVSFDSFDPDTGVLKLAMHGACSGCPKSNVTLQIGIKNLMTHFIPEVKDVQPVDDGAEEEMPTGPTEMKI